MSESEISGLGTHNQWRILDGISVELTEDEVEHILDGGLTRLPAPEDSDHDYVEIDVKSSGD